MMIELDTFSEDCLEAEKGQKCPSLVRSSFETAQHVGLQGQCTQTREDAVQRVSLWSHQHQ
jgi:hypothetical protein